MHPIHVLPGLTAAARRVSLGTDLAIGRSSFGYTGAIVQRVVPDGVHTLNLLGYGGGGGGGFAGGFRAGGAGGGFRLSLAVQPGDLVEFEIGQGGGAAGSGIGGLGGYPDGGDGSAGSASQGGGGGGGSTRVWINGVLVAVGGGGAGEDGGSGINGDGGNGGGASGGLNSSTAEGTAATQTAAGTCTTSADRNGSGRFGGDAYESGENRSTVQGTGNASGGGGGGLWGGYGGGTGGSGGGGGSGFAIPLDGGSNSPLDREFLYSSTAIRAGSDPIPYFWDSLWSGDAGGALAPGERAVTNTAGPDGYLAIEAIADGEDVTLGYNPVGLDSTLADQTGTGNPIRFRKYVAPCDMWIDTVHTYRDDSTDSNSGGTPSTTPARAFIYAGTSITGGMGAMIARSATQTFVAGVVDFPLETPVFIPKGQSVYVGINTGSPSWTRTESTRALPSGDAATLSAAWLSEPSVATETLGSAQTSAYSWWCSGFSDEDPVADFAMDVVPFNTPTSTGTFDITGSLGGRTPKAVIILATQGADASVTSHINLGIGAASRVSGEEWCMSASTADNAATSNTDTEQRPDAIISICTPGEPASTGLVMRANVDSWIADGVRLNFTTTEGTARRMMAIFIAGDDAIVSIFQKTDWNIPSPVQYRLGFQPTFVIFGGEFSNGGNGSGTNTTFSFGLGMLDSFGNAASFGWSASGALTAGGRPSLVCSNTKHEVQASATAASFNYVESTVNSDGFSYNPNGGAASLNATDTLVIACSIRGRQARVFNFDTPTATGVQSYTTPGFQPEFALLCGTSVESLDTGIWNTNEASGIGIAAFDTGGGYGFGFSNELSDPTNTNTVARADRFMIGRVASPETLSANWDGFDADGFDLDWTAVHTAACKCFALCIGPA